MLQPSCKDYIQLLQLSFSNTSTVLSAYWHITEFRNNCAISFPSRMNNNGRKISTCGTPYFEGKHNTQEAALRQHKRDTPASSTALSVLCLDFEWSSRLIMIYQEAKSSTLAVSSSRSAQQKTMFLNN